MVPIVLEKIKIIARLAKAQVEFIIEYFGGKLVTAKRQIRICWTIYS
jgi:hypothetical protein